MQMLHKPLAAVKQLWPVMLVFVLFPTGCSISVSWELTPPSLEVIRSFLPNKEVGS